MAAPQQNTVEQSAGHQSSTIMLEVAALLTLPPHAARVARGQQRVAAASMPQGEHALPLPRYQDVLTELVGPTDLERALQQAALSDDSN
mmetsp:Transcript_26152/g.43251  ORF Transcript_26152/g.43251 Transcript_26152/m.43251 type:complete len:89 (+) Transcript_26152:180-446(+)